MSVNEKTLVIILSETRAHDLTFNSFYRNLLLPHQADLALCVAANDLEETDNPFYRHATYVWTYPEPEDWSTALDFAQKKEGIVNRDWRQLFAIKGNFIGGLNDKNGRVAGSGGISMFFRWYLKQCLLEEPGLLERYDRYILTRSDFMYLVPHYPLSQLDAHQIWLPLGEDYHGYTDRHIVANRDQILPAISLIDPILRTPEDLYHELEGRQDYLSFEGYIGYLFQRTGLSALLRRYPYTMYAVRHPDGRTSWSKGSYNERLGYCIKYKPEYIQSLLPTAMIKRPSDWSLPATAAYFMVSDWMEAIDEFARFKIRAIPNPKIQNTLIKLFYGTLLSDHFYQHVYPRLAAFLANVLNVLPDSLSMSQLRKVGYLSS